MASTEDICNIVRAGIPSAEVTAKDLTGTGDHFELTVVCSEFSGKNSIDRHRMVYQALGLAVGTHIHAVTLHTLTPEESGRK